MKEAQRKAEAKLAELAAQEGSMCEHAVARVNALLDQLKANLNEFENTLSEQLEASKANLKRWRRETRQLVSGLGELRLKAA
jgi:vacuolar-type H+-ATPase subunit I/STV1